VGYGLDNPDLKSRQVQEIFCSAKRPDWFWGPKRFLSSGYRCSFVRVKWTGLDVDYSSPSTAEVKN
jgi:hypothetical protein